MQLFFLFLTLLTSSRAFLPLGNTSNFVSITCPSGFYTGAVCKNMTISCSGIPNIVVTIGVITPSGTLNGTTVLQNGGGGTAAFDMGYVSLYLAAKLKVVQVKYESDWFSVNTSTITQNLTLAACRPATVSKAIFTNIHGGSLTKGFCHHGHSGGAAAIAFSLSWYGADSWVDYGLLSAGPNFSNSTASCIVPATPKISVCPNNGQTYCSQTSETFLSDVEFPICSHDVEVRYKCNCSGTSNQTAIDAWNSQSIINGFSMTYSHIKLSSWVCKLSSNNHPGEAELYSQKVSATNGYSLNLITSCAGSEGVWGGTYTPTGQSGLTASSNALIAGCIPHH